jgi:hypothetical protein
MERTSYTNAAKPQGHSNEGSPDHDGQKILMESFALWHSVFPNGEKRDLEVMLVAYAKVLAPLSAEQLARACSLVLERSRFFPTPAEILELVSEPVIQGLELEAESAYEVLLRDFEEWADYRNAKGEPLKKPRIVWSKEPCESCPQCGGTAWCRVDEEDRSNVVRPCPCADPREGCAPHLPAATLYALRRLGGYRAVSEEVSGQKVTSWIHKQFIDAYLYYRKTGGLAHLPAAKTDAALLNAIVEKAGVRLLKS